jgi:hypothetical protein
MLDLRQWSLALLVREAQRRIEIQKLAGLWDCQAVDRINRAIFRLVMERPFSGNLD